MTGGNIGLNYYTTFDPGHKPILDGKIIDHFYNREIGYETVDMFRLAMRRTMNEIMPYYNQLYETETLEFDPLATIKIHTVAFGKELQAVDTSGNGTTESENDSGSRTVTSTMPQTMLAGNADYADTGVDSNVSATGTSSNTTSQESDSETNTDNDSQTEGYQAYPSNLIQQYRDIILNIDMLIIADLETLFMGIWNNGDAYVPNNYGYFSPLGPGFGYGNFI
jgi:hypothetical protein